MLDDAGNCVPRFLAMTNNRRVVGGARASTTEVWSGGHIEVTCDHGRWRPNRTAGWDARPARGLLLVMVGDGVILHPVKALARRVSERNMPVKCHQL